MTSLHPNELIAEAREISGLRTFGDDDFIEPLTVLTRSIMAEGRLTASGLERTRQKLIHSLISRLRLEEFYRRYPEIENEAIVAPTVVLGLQRSGTTKLFRVLASDPQWHVLRTWEGITPTPLDFGPPSAEDRARRIEIAAGVTEELNRAGLATAHEFDPLAPEQESLLMLKTFMVPSPDMRTPSQHHWCETADYVPAYRYLKRQLKFLQWQRAEPSPKRWMLKTPGHLHDLGALVTIFPDAHLVMTHRHPKSSVASMMRVQQMVWSATSDQVDPRAIGQIWLRNLSRAHRRALEFRDHHPEKPILDLAFKDVVTDSSGVVKRICAFANAPFTEMTCRAIADWERANPQGKHGQHVYALEDFGLSRDDIEQAFRAYIERFAEYWR